MRKRAQSICNRLCQLSATVLVATQLHAEPFVPVTTSDPSIPIPAGGNGDSFSPVISADGRYVAFASAANSLVLNGSNAMMALSPPKLNVFLRDRTNGTTVLISPAMNGIGGGNSDSTPVAVSTNGQFVLFESAAGNLAAGAANGLNNIFRRDVTGGTTALVSVNTNGAGSSGASRSAAMTPDGRYVTFVSEASDLVAGDTNSIADIFVHDMQSGVTTLASPGATGPGSSELPDITPDGHYVVFYSTATNLAAASVTGNGIYIRDLIGGTTTLASSYAATAVSNVFNSSTPISFNFTVSDDGQYVAYEAASTPATANSVVLRFNTTTTATDVIDTNAAGPLLGSELTRHMLDMTPDGRFIAYVANTNNGTCVKQWDAQSASSTLASGDLNGNAPTNGTCDWPAMDATGRYVSFTFSGTAASSLTSNSVAGGAHVYVRDMQAATTKLVDVDTNGAGSALNPITFPRLSADGQAIAFEAYSSSLVTNDNNHYSDIFVGNLAGNPLELISVRRPEAPSMGLFGPSTFTGFSTSFDGRYVVFASEGTNVTQNDTNGFRDVFLHDRVTGSNQILSVTYPGLSPSASLSQEPTISGDGRYVAFSSYATNLFPGGTNNFEGIYYWDLQIGRLSTASISTLGALGNGPSYAPTISTNGRYVLFHSQANNLAPGSAGGPDNVYVRDLTMSRTTFLTNGGPSGTLLATAMTPDGRYMAVAGNNIGVHIWDMQTGGIIYTGVVPSPLSVGISPDGTRLGYHQFGTAGFVYVVDRTSNTVAQIGAGPAAKHMKIRFSGDSRYMTYVGAGTISNQVYVYDFQTRSNLLVSRGYNRGGLSAAGNGDSDSPDISSDGRFIAYRSMATNLVPGISNFSPNIYLYDRVNGVTTLATVSQYGNFAAAGRSLSPGFSGDGRTLFIESTAQDLSTQGFSQWSGIFALNVSSTNAPAPISLQVAAGGTGQVVITWTAAPGRSYQVQYKTNLTDANWQALSGDSVAIVGTQATATDLNTAGQRFYRVAEY